jgi:type I restriction enzyme S subunit
MDTKLLFDNFDLLFDSHESIPELRETILLLAVQGKLVPQDTKDEPASKVLERIKAEKEQLIKVGKLKNEKPVPIIKDEEIPFELSKGWSWCRVGTLSTLITKGSSPKWQGINYIEENSDGILFITSKNVGVNCLVFNDKTFVERKFNDIEPRSILKKGDILTNIVGSIGRTALFDLDCDANINQAVCIIRINDEWLNKQYLLYYFNSKYGTDLMHSKKFATGRGNLSMGSIRNFYVPLPPLEEQKRIVAKVDELMRVCDDLEAMQKQTSEDIITLNTSALAKLSDAKTDQAFNNEWGFISDNFDNLYCTQENVKKLKDTILQLAVQGKLGPQNPKDAPASSLLERIKAKKESLVKNGKAKKQKMLPEIKDDEITFQVPQSWALSRLGDFTFVGTGATPSRGNPKYYSPAKIPWVTSGETSSDLISNTKELVSPLAVKETNVSICPVGTLIIAMYGQGKTRGQISELLIEAGTNQACATVQPIAQEVHHRKYIKYFFRKAYKELRSHAAGGAQPNLNLGKVAQTIVPLPPLEEQKRIVAKVESLMAMCNELEQQLIQSKEHAGQLMQSVLQEAFAE